ncbi:MAG: C25 family cysteine peptidase [Bacteroidales bacterium]
MNRLSAHLIWIFIVFGHFAHGQSVSRVDLKSTRETGFQVVQKKPEGLKAVNKLAQFQLTDKTTPEGLFKTIETEGFVKSFSKGYPDLPVKTKLLQIPEGAKVEVKVKEYKEELIPLKQRGIHQKIIPAQPSRPKSQEDDQKFFYNERVYQTNRFWGREPVKVKELGTMRGVRLGRLEISPFQYNPVSNQLKVIKDLEFEIDFIGGETSKSGIKAETSDNPYSTLIENNTINKTKSSISPSAKDGPLTYVIISPPDFEDQLQPFIRWKSKKGFRVIEGYTDSIGNSSKEIKNFLQKLYEQPEHHPPSFVLLVGDIEQIPSWAGKTGGSHVTDLYYCEYTGDQLPEVFYGRFPATDTSQLHTMINKTLEYEKYEIPDPQYLKEALLVAGNDEEYEDTYVNGEINYITSYYFNRENGIDARAFLQDPPNGNEAVSDSIVRNINKGMGFTTYSAHCISEGWSKPSFMLDDITSLTDNGKFGLWISNCCWSMKFDDPECFGEAALRAENKGAVGAIGASDETYWDEDYWWSVGLTDNIMSNPTYEDSELGMYDRLFHSHGENPSEWYITQGQMIAAGNLAVEASPSDLNDYYWEIYHLMGDPSLMPYFGIPDTISMNLNSDDFYLGMDNLTVNADPFIYVAISYNEKLLDAGFTDETGTVNLSFPKIQRPGKLELVATGQNKQPFERSFEVNASNQPYLIINHTTFRNSSGDSIGKVNYGDTVTLDMVLENVSDSLTAYQVTDSLYTGDPYIKLTENYKPAGKVPPDTLSEEIKGFKFVISDSVKDQHEAEINLDIRGEDDQENQYLWQSSFRLNVNAPSLSIGSIMLDDGPAGNDSLDPGESADLRVVVHNEGHAPVSSVKGKLNITHGQEYVSIGESLDEVDLIEQSAADTFIFRISADPDSPESVPVYCNIDAKGGARGQYQASDRKRLILGSPDTSSISKEGNLNTSYTLFYDSGGPEENYGNEEHSRLTFLPEYKGFTLSVDFRSFDVESDFDSLRIFDGTSTAAPLIGIFNNSNKPGQIVAKNDSGALTFEFHSDQSITRSGWEAEIAGLPLDTVTFTVSNGNSVIEGAEVLVDGNTYTTDSTGEVTFVLNEGTYEYSVIKEGYRNISGILELEGNMEKTFVLKKTVYDVTFELYEEDGKTPVDGEVILDGSADSTSQGTCSFQNIWSVGNHSYNIHVPEHYTDSGSFELNADTTIHITLEKIKYPMNLQVVDEQNQPLDSVRVDLDTNERYTGQNGKVQFMVPRGNYQLYLHKDHYTEHQDKLQIKDTTSRTIELARLYAVEFNVISKPDSQAVKNAQIHIDTLEIQTDSLGSARCELTGGKYEYTVKASGYGEYRSNIDISRDSSLQVVLSEASSLQESPESNDIVLYPNPTSGLVQIKNETGYKSMKIHVYNLTGKTMLTKVLEGTHATLDLRNYPEGLYLLQVSKNGIQITQKLLVE